MLRDGDERATSWSCRLVKLSYDLFVFRNMLEDIEGAHDIELLVKGNLAGVYLVEGRVGEPPTRCRETRGEELSADKLDLRKALSQSGEDEPCTATHLEEIPGVRKVFAHGPGD